MKMLEVIQSVPRRTPIAVSDAIRDIIEDKVVCDLGCAEGDNMVFMARYARKVLGVEQDRRRYRHAQARGQEVVVGDYLQCELPEAEVYYIWPNDGPHDNEILVQRLVETGRSCTVIVAGDTGFPYEIPTIQSLASQYNGKLLEVPFNEGPHHRQSGTFLLCILELP